MSETPPNKRGSSDRLLAVVLQRLDDSAGAHNTATDKVHALELDLQRVDLAQQQSDKDIEAVRKSVKEDIEAVRKSVKEDIAEVKQAIADAQVQFAKGIAAAKDSIITAVAKVESPALTSLWKQLGVLVIALTALAAAVATHLQQVPQ